MKNVVSFEEWQTEHYEMTLFTSRRGVSTWKFELVRVGMPSGIPLGFLDRRMSTSARTPKIHIQARTCAGEPCVSVVHPYNICNYPLHAEVEKVEVVLGLQRLFSPRVVIAFPPPGFVFHKGVGPFWKINVEEDSDELEVRRSSLTRSMTRLAKFGMRFGRLRRARLF